MSVAAKKRCKYPATQELFTYLTGLGYFLAKL